MTERRLSIPDCVALTDGEVYHQIIRHHCLAKNLSYEKQGGHYFIKENDFLAWLTKYKNRGFKVGPKPLRFNYDAAADLVVVAKEV